MPIKHLSWGMGLMRRLAGGVPAPTFVSATTNTAGTVVTVTFSKAMADPSGKHASFTVNDGSANAVTAAALNATTTKIDLTLTNAIENGDTVTVAYTKGTVASADTGSLASFSAQSVTNAVPSLYPNWINYPDGIMLLSEYPYQAVVYNLIDAMYLNVASTTPLYFTSDSTYRYVKCNKVRRYTGSAWDATDYNTSQQALYTKYDSQDGASYYREANENVYTNSSLTTILFAENV